MGRRKGKILPGGLTGDEIIHVLDIDGQVYEILTQQIITELSSNTPLDNVGYVSRDNTFTEDLDFTLADFTHYLRGYQSGALTFTIDTPPVESYKLVETEFNTDGSAINLPARNEDFIELKNEYASCTWSIINRDRSNFKEEIKLNQNVYMNC